MAPVLSEQQQKLRDMAIDVPSPQPIAAKPQLADPLANIPPRPARHASLAQGSTKEKDATPFPVEKELDQDPADVEAAVGSKCKRLGCGMELQESTERSADECCFHPGVPSEFMMVLSCC
jgi:hypothetical protein